MTAEGGSGALAAKARARSGRLATYLRLGRVSNLPTVWTNLFAGVALAGGRLDWGTFGLLFPALSLFYVGGMFLNDAFDREIDAAERPDRPIPAGDVSAAEVFAAGFGMMAVALGLLALNAARPGTSAAWTSVGAGVALAGCITLYDAWHKQNPLSPFVMGSCRALVYVTAGLAAGGALTAPLLGGAAALLGYVVGLTFVARQETRSSFAVSVPLLLLASPAAVAMTGAAASPVTLLALMLWAGWVAVALKGLFLPRGPVNVPRAVVRLIAGISLVDGLLIAAHGEPAFLLAALAGLGATLALQRFVRGT